MPGDPEIISHAPTHRGSACNPLCSPQGLDQGGGRGRDLRGSPRRALKVASEQAWTLLPDSSSFLSNFLSILDREMPPKKPTAERVRVRGSLAGPHGLLPAGHVARASAQARSALCAGGTRSPRRREPFSPRAGATRALYAQAHITPDVLPPPMGGGGLALTLSSP